MIANQPRTARADLNAAILSQRRMPALDLPLTCEFSGQAEKVLVISHPGWSRRMLPPAEMIAMRGWCEAELQRRQLPPALGGLVLPKVWFLERGEGKTLLLELLAEEALYRARRINLPIVATVPSQLTRGSGGDYELVPADHRGQELAAYLRATLGRAKDCYILPTNPESGACFGYDAKISNDEALYRHYDSPVGQHLLAPLGLPKVNALAFCGGFFDACLWVTLCHFVGRTALSVVDNLSLSDYEVRFNLRNGKVTSEKREVRMPVEITKEAHALLNAALTGERSYDEARGAVIHLFFRYGNGLNSWQVFDKTDNFYWQKLLPMATPEQIRMFPSFVAHESLPNPHR